MSSTMSTETLLNSFPMFGHPGISALEYAGALAAARERNTSVTSDSLKRKSTTSTQYENTTPPTTAGAEPLEPDMSPSVQFIDEFGCQQRRRGTFLNHTPRDFEMRSSKTIEVYRPTTASTENYSRPRTSYQTNSRTTSHASGYQYGYSSPNSSHFAEKKTTVNLDSPVELDSHEIVQPSSPEVYQLLAIPPRRSASVPSITTATYQPRSISSIGYRSREVSAQSTATQIHHPQDKKRQRRQTPFKVSGPRLSNSPRHSPLEPWIAKHRRKETNESFGELPTEADVETLEEIGTFGVIQRYFDSQTGGPVSPPKLLCHACSPKPLNIPFLAYPEPDLQMTSNEPTAIFPINELNLPDEPPPAVPDRSPKRLTNPAFPIQVKSVKSMEKGLDFALEGKHSTDGTNSDDLHMPNKRAQTRVDVRQAARAGSSHLGRMAPPILGHDALKLVPILTANQDSDMNHFRYYLKHTGPAESQTTSRQRKHKKMRIFRIKQRKSLAARVGSVEGSPQRARKQHPVPACARETVTSGGARHLKIIIPTDSVNCNQPNSTPVVLPGGRRRSRHMSITFTEEMLNPLAGTEVECMLSGFQAPTRSSSEPALMLPRSPKRVPISPKLIPVSDHPLASREEQTRARKLRDLQRIRRKPLADTHIEPKQPTETVLETPVTPSQTPELVHDSTIGSPDDDNEDRFGAQSPAEKMGMMQERVVLLQRQNTELTEALAKIVGLELEEGDLKSEDVLKAFRQIRHSRMLSAD